jgi:hypothetical protein
MVPLLHIYLREVGASGSPRRKVQHAGDGVGVRDCDAVEALVVTAGVPAAILLLDYVQGGGPGAV